MTTAIHPIAPSGRLTQFLAACDLPVADIGQSETLQFFAQEIDGQLSGVVGLELYPPFALLRSLAVAPHCRGSGLGRTLLAFAEQQAAVRGVDMLFLLTTSAAPFFAAYGYANAQRSEAPAAIQTTAQFSGLCPASSSFMAKFLRT